MGSEIPSSDTVDWFKIKTDIAVRMSMINDPYHDVFLIARASTGRNRGSQWGHYNSMTIRDGEVGLA